MAPPTQSAYHYCSLTINPTDTLHSNYISMANFPLIVFISLIVSASASADMAKDRAECTEQLVGMATCLPYVEGGGAKAPTPDCCSGLKTVLVKSPKCLCVLVKDRDDPNLGFKIDLGRALALPSACNTPANISECPKLLKLPPNSPEAEVFKHPGNAAEANATGSSGNLTGTPQSSRARSQYMGMGRKMWLEVEMVGGILLLLLMPFMIFTG